MKEANKHNNCTTLEETKILGQQNIPIYSCWRWLTDKTRNHKI